MRIQHLLALAIAAGGTLQAQAIELNEQFALAITPAIYSDYRNSGISQTLGDPAAQAEMAMSCVKRLIEEAGGKLEHICKITIYLTDPRYREPVYNVIGRWLKGVYPVSTGLVVQALAKPEMLMEIDVDAVIPEGEG